MASKNGFAKDSGFENLEELEMLISRIDLTDHDTWIKFITWAHEDCTKTGLLLIIEAIETSNQ